MFPSRASVPILLLLALPAAPAAGAEPRFEARHLKPVCAEAFAPFGLAAEDVPDPGRASRDLNEWTASLLPRSPRYVARPRHDTTIELEVPIPGLDSESRAVREQAERAMALLDSDDGTLGPILPEGGAFLPLARVGFREQEGRVAHMLLRRRAAGMTIEAFLARRRVPGLRIAEQALLDAGKFREARKVPILLGQYVDAHEGPLLFRIGPAFRDGVEYVSAASAREMSGYEAHFRYGKGALDGSAGEVSEQARAFVHAAGLAPLHQHAHLVSDLPRGALRSDPVTQVARMAYLIWAGNLAFEILGAEDGMVGMTNYLGDSRRKLEDLEGWPPENQELMFAGLSRHRFRQYVRYLEALAEGKGRHREIEIDKFAMLALKPVEIYDEEGVWGLEARGIPELEPGQAGRYNRLLDSIQYVMETNDHSLAQPVVDAWLDAAERLGPPLRGQPPARRRKFPFSDRVVGSWHNTTLEEAVQTMPRELAEHVPWLAPVLGEGRADNPVDRFLRGLFTRSFAMKGLLQDWDRTPLVIAHPELGPVIREWQIACLIYLRQALEDPACQEHLAVSVATLGAFYQNSGIREALFPTLGLPPE